MSFWFVVAIAAAAALILYAAFVCALYVRGRKSDARALAGFIPDCVVLFSRLLRDPRVPRRGKLLLALLVGYLSMPFDLVPDFVPVAGQLDDAIIVAFVLRAVLLASGPELAREHWPGPPTSLELVLRIAGYGRRGHAAAPAEATPEAITRQPKSRLSKRSWAEAEGRDSNPRGA
jgi:uncharacterized membrane protein YkvA (DUF1232 family)